ncbi:MAG: phosphatidylglycerol lysyltransferase domain-containing protein [Bacteroidales bacterium]|jgi:hypothetical protein
MLTFKAVTLSDQAVLQPLLYQNPSLLCNWSFSNMILWEEAFHPHYAFINDMLILAVMKDKTKPIFNFPIGNGNVKETIDHLLAYTKQAGMAFRMANLTDEMKSIIEESYPQQFNFEERRDQFDYIYKVEDLLYLKGKKYQAKRNHINKFIKSYNYHYSPLTTKDVAECWEMQNQWIEENDCGGDNCLMELEHCAVKIALELFDRLNMKGGVLRIDNRVVAFTLGQALNANVFDVQIEKALKQYHGAYPMINQQFVEHEMQNYLYVNREEDLNEPGLRQAKLSYHPTLLLKKYVATLKEDQ